MSKADLQEFNKSFSDKWVTVDFDTRLDVLVNARVLRHVGEDYSFRYPYIYYYLKGQYLSENLSYIDIREYVEHCCKHLYVRDHANTILFLAHHTSDEYVINTVAEALQGLFKTCSPVTFDGDTLSLNKLIESAPQLTYSGEPPVAHRKRRSALRDKLDNGYDGLSEQEEESKNLSLIAQLTMLFKTTEILGQVLKNQYAKIRRTRKTELLEQLFNGPLRAVHDFYNLIEMNPDALVVEIEAAIKRKGKIGSEKECKRIARQVVSNLIQLVSFAFVLKAAQAVNSDSLLEDVRNVVKRNGTLAFRLIDVCIHLDSPKGFPHQKLRCLFKEAKNDLVAERLLRIMVMNRLYMFKTTEIDMQWLNSELGINIGIQHAITYKEHKRRFIK